MPLPVTMLTIVSTISNFFKLIDVYGFAPMLSFIFSTCVLPVGHVQKFAKTPKSSKLDMNVWLRTLIYGFKVDMVVLVDTHAQMETLMFNADGFSPIDDHQPPHVT